MSKKTKDLKRNTVYFKMLFVFILILLTEGSVFSQNTEAVETYNFGYSSSQSPSTLIERMIPLMEILSDELGINIEFVHKRTFAEMQKAYINQEIDFGIINAFSFLRIVPYDAVIPIAARRIEHSKKYQSYFFARKESGINSIEELKGKVVALGDPYSTSSYLIPHHMFRAAGIVPDSDFSKTIIISKQDSLIFSVLNRTADVGVCASFIFNEQPEEVRSELHVFETSELFPLGPFVVNKNLDKEMIDKIQEILLSLTETQRGLEALDKSEIEGFVPVNINDYDRLIEIMKSLNIN